MCTEKDLYEVKSFCDEQASQAVATLLYKRKKALSESSSSSMAAASKQVNILDPLKQIYKGLKLDDLRQDELMDCLSWEGEQDADYDPDSESQRASGHQNRRRQQQSSILPDAVTPLMVHEMTNRNELAPHNTKQLMSLLSFGVVHNIIAGATAVTSEPESKAELAKIVLRGLRDTPRDEARGVIF